MPLPVVLLCQGIRRLTLNNTTFVLPEATIMANVAHEQSIDAKLLPKSIIEEVSLSRCAITISRIFHNRLSALWVPFTLARVRSMRIELFDTGYEKNGVVPKDYTLCLWIIINGAADTLERLELIQTRVYPSLASITPLLGSDGGVENTRTIGVNMMMHQSLTTNRTIWRYTTTMAIIFFYGADDHSEVQEHPGDAERRLAKLTAILRPCTQLLRMAQASLKTIELRLDLYAFTWSEVRYTLYFYAYAGVDAEDIPQVEECPWATLDHVLAIPIVSLQDLKQIHILVRLPNVEIFLENEVSDDYGEEEDQDEGGDDAENEDDGADSEDVESDEDGGSDDNRDNNEEGIDQRGNFTALEIEESDVRAYAFM
ncbi:hypothetical protein NLJ89_g3684 [Agrocybe chaxingu]|uniref:Uncharacterized protein n=1 Tax=Agrocybe chaxingu TaxID=84603 RepID=A0A9W8K4D6_9AGAR|nr:hypothetical protein NLJ89_g3684 [Agrocybe chaxingu]